MNSADYIPTKDIDCRDWALNFSTLITASPTTYGLVSGDATAFAAAYNAFNTALGIATTPATRTSVTVATKDTTRATMVALARTLVAKVQGTTTVTPTQKTNLRITVRKTTRTPIPPPPTRPLMTISSSNGSVLTVRFNDELTPDKRAYPFGTILCEVFMKTGTTPPVTIADCDVLALVGRGVTTLDVSSVTSGTAMHFISRWVNRRGEPGPSSTVVSTVRTP